MTAPAAGGRPTAPGLVGLARPAARRTALVVALLLLAAALVLGCGVGAVPIPPGRVVHILLARVPVARDWVGPVPGPPTHAVILWDIRLPRVILGAVVGAALAVAGATFQGLFQNPMADPYVVGVSAGASLGATAALLALARLPAPGLRAAGLLGVPGAAFLGGLAAVALVYRLASVGRRLPVLHLILADVAVGSMATSLVSLLLLLNQQRIGELVVWLMGGLGTANWTKVAIALPYVAAGVAAIGAHSRDLNALLLGEEQAGQLGVEVEAVKRRLLLAGALLTAGAVSFAGNIGFVGLVVPHAVRLVVGPDHRYLLPVAALAGAAVLVLADAAARTLLGPSEIPVGAVMSLAGGPFFLYLLRRHMQGVPRL